MTIVNVALLSRWHVHADDYAREAIENDLLNIEMVWDEDINRGRKWANELGVPFEQDLQTVLSNSAIDAVIVTTPTNLHKEIILEAAKHKKHIFTEKVLAFTSKDCKDILETVETQGVELMVSLPRLAENDFLYAEKSLKDGWIGRLTMLRCRLAHNGAVVMEGKKRGWLPNRFFEKSQTGGGSLIDLGAHPIYLTNRLAGPAHALYARLQKLNNEEVDDSAAVLVEYDSGALGVIETGFLSHGSPFQLELYGTEGTLLIKGGKVTLKSIHVNDDKWINLEEPLPLLPNPMVQWITKINSGTTPSITKEDVINLTLINEMAALSHYEGRRVVKEEITGE